MQKRNNVGQVWILQSDLRGKAYNNRYPQRSHLEVRDEGLLRLGDQGIWGIKMRMYQIMQLALTDISLHPKLEFFYQMSIFCDFDPPFIQILHLTAFKSCCSNLFSQIDQSDTGCILSAQRSHRPVQCSREKYIDVHRYVSISVRVKIGKYFKSSLSFYWPENVNLIFLSCYVVKFKQTLLKSISSIGNSVYWSHHHTTIALPGWGLSGCRCASTAARLVLLFSLPFGKKFVLRQKQTINESHIIMGNYQELLHHLILL